MKFAKHLMAATALAAVGFAQATAATIGTNQPTVLYDDARGSASTNRRIEINTLNNTGTIYLSNGRSDLTVAPPSHLTSVGGAVGAMNVLRSRVTAVGNSTVTQEDRSVGSNNRSTRSVINVSTGMTGIATDNASGQLLSLSTAGGATISADANPGIGLGGGEFTFKNLTVDFNTKTVLGTLVGAAESYSGAIWTFGSWDGPSALPLNELIQAIDGNSSSLSNLGYEDLGYHPIAYGFAPKFKGVFEIYGLAMTEDTHAVLGRALGLEPGGTASSVVDGLNNGVGGWGTMRYEVVLSANDAILTPPVPEPSTYAMFGLGLVGVWAMTQGRRQQLASSPALA